MRFGIPVLVGLLLAVSATAQAQNLVVNAGFETGDFTGWAVTGENTSVEPDLGHTGSFAASFGAPAPSVDVLSQTLPTQIGQRYLLSFFAQTPAFNIPPGSPNSLTVFFGGNQVIGPTTVQDSAGYHQFSSAVKALSKTTELRFEVSNDPDFTQLDDVSVTVLTTAAPEPNALALLTSGLAWAMLVLYSRRKARFGDAAVGWSRRRPR